MRHRFFFRALFSIATLLLIMPMRPASAQLPSPVADLDWLSGAWVARRTVCTRKNTG